MRLLVSENLTSLPTGSIVAPFCGLYLGFGSHKVIPKKELLWSLYGLLQWMRDLGCLVGVVDLGVAGSELAALKLEAFGWREGFSEDLSGFLWGFRADENSAASSCSFLLCSFLCTFRV